MQVAYVALGANLGDREASLRGAIRKIADDAEIEISDISPVYETAPVGYTEQPSFLNMITRLRTELSPIALLRRMLAIEQEMGRVRDIRWGPRNIDLDVLLVGQTSMETPELTLPHPRMGERAFVLVPLRDIWIEELIFPWERQLSTLSCEEEGITQWARWSVQDVLR